MRWKILELAGKGLNLEEILAELENHTEFGLDREAAIDILRLYQDTLSDELREQLSVL